jgi:hypothetical protein
MIEVKSPRFQLGCVVATPGAIRVLHDAGVSAWSLLARHARGDWGDLDDDDRRANNAALVHGSRLLSAYELETGDRVWVLTQGDRMVTTILLPEEY